MAKKDKAHVSETPATAMLRQHGIAFTEGTDPQVCVALLGARAVQCALAE